MARVTRFDSHPGLAPHLVIRRGALDHLLLGVLFAVVWAALWSSFIVGVEARSAAPTGSLPAVAARQVEAPPRG